MAQVIAEGSAAVLAGGRSSRFGSDKALADWRGTRLVERVSGGLLRSFPSVLVLAKDPARYGFLERPGLRIVPDRLALSHPLSGLAAALEQAPTERVFVTACDMPFLQERLIELLWEAGRSHEAAVPVWRGRLEPLCAVYSRSCAGAVGQLLSGGAPPLRALLERVRARLIGEEELRAVDPEGASFTDLDERRDYERALERAHAR